MKKTTHLIILWMVIATSIKAQAPYPHLQDAKRNNFWITGYENQVFDMYPNAGSVCLQFADTATPTPVRCESALDFVTTCATICDTSGQLAFYTNGIWIGNRNLDKMSQTDTLNKGYSTTFYLTNPNQEGIRAGRSPQGIVILPYPNQDNRYILLHTRSADPPINDGSGTPKADKLLYSVVDMSLNNGLGGIIETDHLIFTDTLAFGMQSACRHANGRDWWFILWEYDSNRYMPVLIDPTGVHPQGWQSVGQPIGLHTIKAQTCFSPDGRKYARHEGYDWQDGTGNYLSLFNFNRCTGRLSNQTTINIPVEENTEAGVAFSENSRYLYASTAYDVFQFDMSVPISQVAATQDTVAHFDGFNDGGSPWTTFFSYLQLAPNGKIYGPTTSTTRYMHCIEKPNEGGDACLVNQHSLFLGSYNWYTLPNQPYFKLGPMDGSVCDTLGIDAVYVGLSPPPTLTCSQPTTTLVASPQPAGAYTYLWSNGSTTATAFINNAGTYTVTVTAASAATYTASVVVSSSVEILQPVITEQAGLLSLPVQYVFYQWYFNGQPIIGANAPTYTATLTGDYSVVVRDANGCAGLSEVVNVVVVGTSSVVEGSAAVEIYPNPSTGEVTIALDKPYEQATFVVTNMLGQTVHTSSISHQKETYPLPLLAGAYILRVYDGDILVHTAKILILSN